MPYFSIFTPTHNPKYLLRAAESLAAQTFKDFEWVILPNGNAALPELHKLPNCKIVQSKEPDSKKIGLFKRECCNAATGRVLVEFDHDDELTPDCLQELHAAFSNDSDLDFAYSNDADLDKVEAAVKGASSFMGVGAELKKAGIKYTFVTEMIPMYMIPVPGNTIAIVNKKYAAGAEREVKDIAIGLLK